MTRACFYICLVALPLAAGCDESGSAARSKGGAPGDGETTAMDGERPRPRRSVMRPRRSALRARPRVTHGPTGVAECDEAVEIVCRCAKKNASLGQPCKTLKADAARWKAQARSEDPTRLADTRKSCRRILESIQKAYGCK